MTGRAASARPIRPCMVSFYFHPDYSGSAVQAYNLSQRLRGLGAAPSILSANLSDSPSHEVIDGIPVHRVPVAPSGTLQIPSFWASAAKFLWTRRDEFDLIHAHGTLQHGVASIMGRLLRKPTILKVAMADSDLAFERQGRLNGSVNRWMVTRFDRFIATTPAIAAEMEARGLDTRRIRLIPNGVDTARFSPPNAERSHVRRELGLPDEPLVSCVAIINERKNIDGLLRIWRDVVSRGLPGHLALIGPVPDEGGSFHTRLLEFVAKHNLGHRVSFLGKRDPIVPYLQASDVFLFPSRQEGMPNSVLEAMACGVPCVVTRGAGTEQIITDGENGYTLGAEDEEGFASATGRLLADRNLCRSFGAKARNAVVGRFSLDGVASQYWSLYQELMSSVVIPSSDRNSYKIGT